MLRLICFLFSWLCVSSSRSFNVDFAFSDLVRVTVGVAVRVRVSGLVLWWGFVFDI